MSCLFELWSLGSRRSCRGIDRVGSDPPVTTTSCRRCASRGADILNSPCVGGRPRLSFPSLPFLPFFHSSFLPFFSPPTLNQATIQPRELPQLSKNKCNVVQVATARAPNDFWYSLRRKPCSVCYSSLSQSRICISTVQFGCIKWRLALRLTNQLP